jgi:hypothetical protein
MWQLREKLDIVTFADHEGCEAELRSFQTSLLCSVRKGTSDLGKLFIFDLEVLAAYRVSIVADGSRYFLPISDAVPIIDDVLR